MKQVTSSQKLKIIDFFLEYTTSFIRVKRELNRCDRFNLIYTSLIFYADLWEPLWKYGRFYADHVLSDSRKKSNQLKTMARLPLIKPG